MSRLGTRLSRRCRGRRSDLLACSGLRFLRSSRTSGHGGIVEHDDLSLLSLLVGLLSRYAEFLSGFIEAGRADGEAMGDIGVVLE